MTSNLLRSVVKRSFREHLKREVSGPTELGWHVDYIVANDFSIDQYDAVLQKSEEYRLRRRMDSTREIVEFEGCRFDLPLSSLLMGQLKLETGYEPWVLPEFLSLCLPGMYVADVGANWGVYSIPAARRVGSEGRVWSFEANSKNAEYVRDGIALNELTNVTLIPAAVGQGFGYAIMPDLEATNAGEVDFTTQSAGVVIPVMTLDSIFVDQPRLDLIKLDIEGSEYKAIIGGTQTIDRFRPEVFLEFCPKLLKDDSLKLLEYFLDREYKITMFPYDGPREVLSGERQSIIDRIMEACTPKRTHVDLRLTP